MKSFRQQYADKQNISFFPAIVTTSTRMHDDFASSFSTGPPGDRGTLQCHWRAIATQPIGLVPVQARGILPVFEDQSRTSRRPSGGVADQPQCRGLWHSSSPSARSLSRSSSFPPPSFTQSPFPPRSLARDGQTCPPGLGSTSLVAHVLHYPPTRTAL
jgi:hypothetical protein